MRLRNVSAAALAMLLGLAQQQALALTAEAVNGATFASRPAAPQTGPDPFIVKAQVLLSRRSISPGVIDGLDGENVRKAVAQFRRQENLPPGEELDEEAWAGLSGDRVTDIVGTYEITQKDAGYDFAEAIPRDYAKQAEMKRLSYVTPQEMLGERFHMSEGLIAALNPDARLTRPGEPLLVVSVQRTLDKGSARRLEAVKSTGMLVVYGEGDAILASYPATIGSDATPSPSGEHTVERVARNPNYTYDPEKNFQQGRNTDRLVLPPGPNGPVGTVWIALSKPTFGIHGTPEPSKVSKTNSHGCVRLTNWDAEELANLVAPGVPVRFVD
ncbi:MAG: L,D-transpeptidase family protein [Bosea sp. (in: a-proteobacteria)]